MKILAAVLLFALSAARACAAFDVSMFDDRMDKTFLSERGAAFRIAYSAWSVREYAKVFKVAVPKSLEFENLKITVFAANLTERELGYAQTKIPFSLSASPFTISPGTKFAVNDLGAGTSTGGKGDSLRLITAGAETDAGAK